MTDQPRPDGQLEVQRWLGRCMLRLQPDERLLKELLAHHELAGPVDTLEAQQAANLEKSAARPEEMQKISGPALHRSSR